MWKVILTISKTVLAEGFKTLHEANEWHDTWIDDNYPAGDHPSVTFLQY